MRSAEVLSGVEQSLALTGQAHQLGQASYLEMLDALRTPLGARRTRPAHLEVPGRAAPDIPYLDASGGS